MSAWWWVGLGAFAQIVGTVLYRAGKEAIAQWDDLHEYEGDEPL